MDTHLHANQLNKGLMFLLEQGIVCVSWENKFCLDTQRKVIELKEWLSNKIIWLSS